MPVGTVAACKALLSRRAAHSITSSDGSSGEGIIGDVRSTNAHSVRAMQGLRSLRKTLSDDDEDAKNVRCGVISCVAAIVLLVAGFVMMHVAHYDDHRVAAEHAYNAAVDEWAGGAGQAFNATTWELVVGGTTIPLMQETTTDVFSKDMASEPLEGYAPLRFVTNGLVPVAGDDDAALVAYTDLMTPAPPPSGNRTADLLALQERSVGIQAAAEELMAVRSVTLRVTTSGRSQDIELEPTAMLQRTEKPAGGWKVCKYQMAGYYSARTRVCTTYTTLESVCVQVTLDADTNQWRLDDRFGGQGCSPTNAWQPYVWRRVRSPQNGQLPVPTFKMLAPFAATTVRSAADPFLYAINTTGGSLVFAQPEAEEFASGTVLVVIGAIASVPACFLFVPRLLRALSGRGLRRRAAAYSRQTDDLDTSAANAV